MISLYNAVTGAGLPGALKGNQKAEDALKLVAQELLKSNGSALVVAGSNDVAIQTVVNAINAHLGSYGTTIDLENTSNRYKGDDAGFAEFLQEMNSGQIDGCILLEQQSCLRIF